jgi:microcystin-dependent protein
VPIHEGEGFTLGQRGGEEAHTITQQEMVTHNHIVNVVNTNATVPPAGNYFAAANNLYQPAPANTNLGPNSVTNFGGSQPHMNMQPFLAVTFAIALQGIFPSQT